MLATLIYMDNYLGSSSYVKEAQEIAFQFVSAFSNGGFRLTKWISISAEFLKLLPKCDVSPKVSENEFDHLPMEQTSGILWALKTDMFCYNYNVKNI